MLFLSGNWSQQGEKSLLRFLLGKVDAGDKEVAQAGHVTSAKAQS